MFAYVLVPLLAAATNSETLSRELQGTCQTGTLIFSQGDCLAVKVFSASRFTHVGAVVMEEGKPVVYDAMNGTGVRKSPLADYLRLQTPTDLQVVHPVEPFTGSEADAFASHLRGELGRPYGLRHHVTGKRADGIHCAEYMTEALVQTERFTAAQPARVSPGRLFDSLTESGSYSLGGYYELAVPEPAPPENETWCQWAWRETRDCTVGCCRQMSRWFLCREKCRGCGV